MNIDNNLPDRPASESLLLDPARWPDNSPLSSTEIKVAQQHAVLGIGRFIAQQGLPQAYRPLFPGLIIPLAAWLLQAQRRCGRPLLVGLSGCQGSGKSTLALALQLILGNSFASRSCVLSLDDFYLSQEDRKKLAARVHPLLATRGVPGTHDIGLLERTLDALVRPGRKPVAIPLFDKGRDNPLLTAEWPTVESEPDIIILEGWCLGAPAQPASSLAPPVNDLEQKEDPDMRWRNYVNDQLGQVYEPLFAKLSPLIYLQPPGWRAVYDWRSRQEHKLISKQGAAYAGGLDSPGKLERFISHYQRITEVMLEQIPPKADVTLALNQNHQFAGLKMPAPDNTD